MGVCFASFTASDDMLVRVHADPPLIWRLCEPDDPKPYLDEIGAGRKPNWLLRIFGKREVPIPDPLPGFEYRHGDRIEIDLDKSWDGINFCMKKLSELGAVNLFESGRSVTKIEIGYGSPQTFTAEETREISNTYGRITDPEILRVYDSEEMKGVYPEGLWRRGGVEEKEYLLENFRSLKIFLGHAAEMNMGLVTLYV